MCSGKYFFYWIALLAWSQIIWANSQVESVNNISANPAATNIISGNGELGNWLGISPDSGVYLGGIFVANSNYLLNGGVANASKLSNNGLFILNLTLDGEKLLGWSGASFSTEFLQFNGQDTNGQAGSVQGYSGLPGPTPLDRSELYQLWYRQALFEDKFIFRIGKSLPSLDFDNVIKPASLDQEQAFIPAISGLLYTPIFINPSMLGVMPGYYNSTYGITASYAPVKQLYVTAGVYDGSLAQGEQTGMNLLPNFNGSYLYIAEVGSNWLLGQERKPGNIGIGAWSQSGAVGNVPNLASPTSTDGVYVFGSQRLWYRNPGVDNSGISAYIQYGINNSAILAMTEYVGAGFSAFGLVPKRASDSFGLGVAWSKLNQGIFTQSSELMYQAYYQLAVTTSIFLEPAVSYIPDPGASINSSSALAATMQLIVLF